MNGQKFMTYSDAIKNSFKLINRNWQLVLIQIAMMIISCIGALIFIGIPLAIAFVMLGLDLTEATRLKDLLSTLRDPSEIISKYLGIVLVLIISFIIYLLVVTVIGLYVFGGSTGVIARAVRDAAFKFTSKAFFSEAKRLFFPLLGFTAIIGLIVIAIMVVILIFVIAVAAIVSISKGYDNTMAVFLGIFLSLIAIGISLILIVCAITLTLYGTAAIAFKGDRPWKATKETVRYLYNHPGALWLYCLLLMGYVVASFLLVLLGLPFDLIPVVGPVLAIPYQLFSYVAQSYLGLVITAVIFFYYFSSEVKTDVAAEMKSEPTAGDSTPPSDISQP